MNRIWALARHYPIVAVTVLVGLVVGGLLLSDDAIAAQWLASGFALIIALQTSIRMIKDLLHGHWGVDVLAVMAIVSTVAVGEYLAALVIVLMLSGGKALEDYAAGRAKLELTALLQRAPQVAHLMQADTDDISDVPVTQVRPGDRLLVRPSEVVPVDGELLSTEASLDESSLTGESLPVTRRTGDDLLSGSLNGGVAIVIRATARVEDSQYQRIVALVEEASQSRAPLVRLADRYAVPFTIVSLLIAGIAWWVSGEPVRFAEVLVLATPCPLLIAAPVAFMGGMSRAAKDGIIVKGGGTLEQLARIRTVAFDKTGTLTYGQPALDAVNPVPPMTANELLALAASAEQYSSHVLATSVLAAAETRGLSLQKAAAAQEYATHGVLAELPEGTVAVGKRRFVSENATGVEPVELHSGQLAIYVGLAGKFAGTIVMSDQLRSNARATLARLNSLGVGESMILTGDAQATADHVAAELGITQVRAECLPAQKVAAVQQAKLRPLLMVGDGVNDAPVLAAADVGVAMGARGSTAASESADVVIMTDDISRVAQAVEIGRRTLRIALQSIWIGIALSVVLMGIAAFGYIPAIAGAATQEVVDLITILNALRARSAGRGGRIVGGPPMSGTRTEGVSSVVRSS
ncbi:MAG TPA: heavy metal translocating P-type ATPase [Propionibacteriaceae bacterium]|nr:heavy metal translocating P-type ATPase [Propionibacteriaceae bacterium]